MGIRLNANKEKLVILVEPIIKKWWFKKFITRVLTKNKLSVYSLEVNKIAFKVSLIKGEIIPEKIILKSFELRGKRSVATWDKTLKIKDLKLKKGIKTKEKIKMVFPYEDIFMISTEVSAQPNNFLIETRQRRLTGELGNGWSKGGPTNICRMPICSVNILNYRITIYTVLILIFTFILMGITLWQVFN